MLNSARVADTLAPRMSDPSLPIEPFDRAITLRNLLISSSRHDPADPEHYRVLRQDFMADARLRPLLPRYVRTCPTLDLFWPEAKAMSAHYEGRRLTITEDFRPLLDHLEALPSVPLDVETAAVLDDFSTDGVASYWRKAMERRGADPEGAITVARTLLESVCKHILDEASLTYDDDWDLPRLYRRVAEQLNLAPSGHTEPVFRQILGGCTSVVQGLGAVRNKTGDAHGRGKASYRAAPRHAHLAVNLAGAMATFLVETWLAQREQTPKTN